mgnify:FL=1
MLTVRKNRQDVVMFDHRTTQATTTDRESITTYQVTKYGDVIATQRNKGVAKGKRAQRIFISKNRFYLSNELTNSELQAVKKWQQEKEQGKETKAPWLPEKRHTRTIRKHYSASEINRKRKELEGLIANNFSGDDTREVFLTLTYRKSFKTETVKRHVKQFERALKDTYSVDYIVVPELNSLGVVHLHYLMRFDDKLNYKAFWDFLESNWKHGFSHVSAMTAPERLGAYLLPYYSKNELAQGEWEQELKSNPEKLTQAEKLLKDGTINKRQAKTIAKKQRLKLLPKTLKVLRKSRGIEKPLTVTTTDKRLAEMLEDRYFCYGEIKEITFRNINSETGEISNDTLIISSDHYKLDRQHQQALYERARAILNRQQRIRESREKDGSRWLRTCQNGRVKGGVVNG